ncbi:uncharacterized protein PG986_006348 [Apiospora aurea]|uniref:Uncharacterized protein n=1 Tax=Apiospora aurea TaxID=335848 RepID=A0ABR1QK57_9PEZI
MDGISAAASVGQLVHYGGAVTVTLIRLIRDIHRGPVIYKSEETNVRHLLRLVRKISMEKDCHTHEFRELFARLDTVAHKILQLLQGTSSSLLRRVISAITRHRALSGAFRELYATRELLHFHISCSLSQDVRACLERRTVKLYKHPDQGSVDSFTAQGLTGTILGSNQHRSRPRFEIVGNNIGYNALIDIGNDTVLENHNRGTSSNEGPIIFKDNVARDYTTLKVGNTARRDFNDILTTHRNGPLEAREPRALFFNSNQTPDGRAEDEDVRQLANPPRSSRRHRCLANWPASLQSCPAHPGGNGRIDRLLLRDPVADANGSRKYRELRRWEKGQIVMERSLGIRCWWSH